MIKFAVGIIRGRMKTSRTNLLTEVAVSETDMTLWVSGVRGGNGSSSF
jgi:hypothetical protein